MNRNNSRYGLDLGKLRSWSKERSSQYLSEETSKQEIAVAKVRAFLDAILTVIRIQAWWRMIVVRRAFLDYLFDKRYQKRIVFHAWRKAVITEKKYLYKVVGQFFAAWREVANEEARLHMIVTKFVQISIRRLRLTPPACMAFFDEAKWDHVLQVTDRMKIRRLVLETLLRGWKLESRQLKLSRYKASKVLSRMMRRTRGPMWVKESRLVCFHLWHRYTAMKNAYRREMPDPRFTNPYLPQWPVLLKDITLKRIKKARTLQKGHILTQKRNWRKWRYLMSVDRSKPATPLAVALYHFKVVWLTKVLAAWSGVVRDRGRVMRFKDKIFYRWRHHTPVFKKLNRLEREANMWMRFRRLRKSYNVMIQLCLVVINKRSKALRKLRKVFCDRKVMVCAYALMQKQEHVMLLDCWRRLKLFWQRRQKWKAFRWNYNIAYHANKSDAIFRAWKSFTKASKLEKMDLLNSPGKDTETEREDLQLFTEPAQRTYNLMMRALEGKIRTKPDDIEFQQICCAVLQAYNKVNFEHKKLALNTISKETEHLAKPPFNVVKPAVQEQLQAALDTNNLSMVRKALDEGAQVEAKHVYQVGSHIGDHWLPFFALLLARGVYFMAERVVKQDISESVSKVFNPMNALLLASHLHRWRCHLHPKGKKGNSTFSALSRGKPVGLTSREISSLTESPVIRDSFGSKYQGVQLLRAVVLELLGRRVKNLIMTCVQLPESRTVDQEVVEVMKRQKIERLQNIQRSLVTLVGIQFASQTIEKQTSENSPMAEKDDVPYMIYDIPPVVKPAVASKSLFLTDGDGEDEEDNVSLQSRVKDIYEILQEYISLTSRMTAEARSLRLPQLERDQQLLNNGFLKSARKDYLALRKQCMTAKQLKEEADKKEKKSKGKSEEKEGKAKGGKKKAATKSKGNKKKGKGAKEDDDNTANESADENELGYNSHSTDGASESEIIEDNSDIEEVFLTSVRDGKDLDAEKAYLRRMRHYRHFFLETWAPTVKSSAVQARIENDRKELEDQKKPNKPLSVIPKDRTEREMEFIPRRLLEFIQKDDHFKKAYEIYLAQQALNQQPSDGELSNAEPPSASVTYIVDLAKSKRVGGVSFYILDFVLSDLNFRLTNTWADVPQEWWMPNILIEKLIFEQIQLEATLTAVNTAINDADERFKRTDKEANRYQKYLKKLRKDLLSIVQHQGGKVVEDKTGRVPFVSALQKAKEKVNRCNKKIKSLHDAIAMAELMVATGNLEAAFNAIDPNAGTNVSDSGSTSTPSLQITGSLVYEKMESVKEEIIELGKRLEQFEVSKLESEALLKGYDQRCVKTNQMLKDLASSKFNTIIDVQQILKRTNAVLKTQKQEAKSKETHHWQKFLLRYSKILGRYEARTLQPRKEMWARELEGRKLREHMFRRAVTESNLANSTSSSRTPSAGGSDSSRPTSAIGKSPMVSETGRRRGILLSDVEGNTAQLSEIQTNAESQNRVLFSMEEASKQDDNTSVTASIADSLQSNVIPDVNDPSDMDALQRLMLAVENEMEAKTPTMSAESLHRREEESRLLAEAEKQAGDNEELRMSIFDEYWSLLPTKEEEEEEASEIDEAPLIEEVIAIPSPELENRTVRMWKSIGEARIREKKEIVDQFMAEERPGTAEAKESELLLILNAVRISRSEHSESDSVQLRDQALAAESLVDPSQHMLLHVPMRQFGNLDEEVWKKGAPSSLVSTSISMRPDTANHAVVETISDMIDKNIASAHVAGPGEGLESPSRGTSTVLSSSVATIKTAVLEANANINKQWKMDPFLVTGKQQADRLRAGAINRSVILGERGIELEDSIEGSNHESASLMSPSQDTWRTATPVTEWKTGSEASKPVTSSSILNEGSAKIDEFVTPSQSEFDHKHSLDFSDELSDNSSRADYRQDLQHQRAVNQYLHLIEEKDAQSLSQASHQSIQSHHQSVRSQHHDTQSLNQIEQAKLSQQSSTVETAPSQHLQAQHPTEESPINDRSPAIQFDLTSQMDELKELPVLAEPVTTSRPPLTPPSTATLFSHPSTPPSFVYFDSLTALSSQPKEKGEEGEKDPQTPKFIRVQEPMKPIAQPLLNISAPALDPIMFRPSEARMEEDGLSLSTVGKDKVSISSSPNYSQPMHMSDDSSTNSMISITRSIRNMDDMYSSGHSTGDNIAVYSGRVGGKFEWALEPSRKSSAAGQQQGGLFFDDSMQLAPSVISLMNFPAPVVAVEVKKAEDRDESSSPVRLLNRLGLLSPLFHNGVKNDESGAHITFDLGVSESATMEESLYDIAHDLALEQMHEEEKKAQFAKLEDRAKRVSFFPSDFFSGEDRTTLALQLQRKNHSKASKEDLEEQFQREIAQERALQQQILKHHIDQLAVDASKKEELADLQFLAVNHIVDLVKTVEELKNHEPHHMQIYSKQFGRLSRALRDIKHKQLRQRLNPPPSPILKPSKSRNEMTETEADDDTSGQNKSSLQSHSTSISPTPSTFNPVISGSMRVQKLNPPKNSGNTNSLIHSKSAIGLTTPNPLTVTILRQSDSENRLAQPKKRPVAMKQVAEKAKPHAAEVDQLLNEIIEDDSNPDPYDLAVVQAVQLLFGNQSQSPALVVEPNEKQWSPVVAADSGSKLKKLSILVDDELPSTSRRDQRPALAEEYERSLDRSNALAAAKIRMGLKGQNEKLILGPPSPTNPKPKSGGSPQVESAPATPATILVDAVCDLDLPQPERAASPYKITIDGDTLLAEMGKEKDKDLDGKQSKAKAISKSATGRTDRPKERERPHEADLSQIVLTGNKPSVPPRSSAAGGPVAVARSIQKSGALKLAPLSLEEYRQQQQQQRSEIASDALNKAYTPSGSIPINAGVNESFIVNEDKFFGEVPDLSQTDLMRSLIQSRQPTNRSRDLANNSSVLSPPSVSLLDLDYLRQPIPSYSNRPAAALKTSDSANSIRDWQEPKPQPGQGLLSEEDEWEMEQELRQLLSEGNLSASIPAAVRRDEGGSKKPRKATSSKLLPPLLSAQPDVVMQEVGSRFEPERVEAVYRGLGTVLKSRTVSQQPQPKKNSRSAYTEAQKAAFVLDPLQQAPANSTQKGRSAAVDDSYFGWDTKGAQKGGGDSFSVGGQLKKGKSEVLLPSVSYLRRTSGSSASYSGSLVSGQNSHITNIS